MLKKCYVKLVNNLIMEKFEHRYLNIQKYFNVGLGIQPILYKRKCIHLKTVVGEVLHYGQKVLLPLLDRLLKINCMEHLYNRQNYFTLHKCFVMNDHNKVE